jgi:hypothetical protein
VGVRSTGLLHVAVAACSAAALLAPQAALGANLFASAEQARALCATSKDWCAGFVAGALDGWAALEAYYGGEKFCLPSELTTGRIVQDFKPHLEENAGRAPEPAAYLLFEMMIAQFPCPDASVGG